jgi:hypothetical protein
MKFGLEPHAERCFSGIGTVVQAMMEPAKDFFMRVLVQNPLTLSYYLSPGKWTRDYSLAHGFNTSQEAISFCLENGLHNLQIVLKFPDDRYDIELPILATREGQFQGHRYERSSALSA